MKKYELPKSFDQKGTGRGRLKIVRQGRFVGGGGIKNPLRRKPW